MHIHQSVRQLLRDKKYREAATWAGAALEQQPTDRTLWLLAAKAVLGMGDKAAALGNLTSLACPAESADDLILV